MANLIKINQDNAVNIYPAKETTSSRKSTWFTGCDEYFTMYGQEMYPAYHPGEFMMCKELTNWDLIPYGNAFLIVTDSLRLVRYVKKSDCPNCLCLVSENPHYDSIDLHKSLIHQLFIVVGTIRRHGY